MKNIIKNINKEKFVCYLIIAFLFISIIVITNTNNKNSLYNDKTYDQNTPIIIQENNKYGYIDSKTGNFIIKPKYSYAERFYGDYALVKVNKKGNNYYRIIDKNDLKKIEFETFVNYEYIKENNMWLIDGKLYDNYFSSVYSDDYFVEYLYKNLYLYKNENKNESGIFDNKKNELFKFEGTNIIIDKNNITDNNIVVNVNNTYYLCDIKTKKIIYKVKDNEYEMSLFKNNIIYLSSNNNSKFIVFNNGKNIYETTDNVENIDIIDDYIILDYGYNYSKNEKKQRYYYYNIKKGELSKTNPNLKNNDENEFGYDVVYKNNKEGLLKDGKKVLETSYDEIKFINKDLFDYISYMTNKELVILNSNKKLEIYNLKKKKIIKTFELSNNSYIKVIDNTPYIKIKTNEQDKKVIFYNMITNKAKVFDEYDSYHVDTNYIIIKKDNHDIYYNSKFNKIYEKHN